MDSKERAAQTEDVAHRVLQYTYGGRQLSGIDSYLLNAYNGLDKSRVKFDFLYRYECPLDAQARATLQSTAMLHSLEIDELDHPLRRQIKEAIRLYRFLRTHKYDAIEINMTSTFMCLQALTIAKIFGIGVRIVHAHDAAYTESFAKRLLKRMATPALRRMATDLWACSADAAKYLFGNKTVVEHRWELINNGIDVDRFSFNERDRSDLRDELDLDGKKVVGVIGRLVEQKNPLRSLRIFDRLYQHDSQCRLVVVGGGPLMGEAKDFVGRHGLQDVVLFLGERRDVEKILNAVDILLAPSFHEGFPVIAVEAQASGVQIVASDAFPLESNLTGDLLRVSLKELDEFWVEVIEKVTPDHQRASASDKIRKAGYDRVNTAQHLEELYHRVFRIQSNIRKN